MNESENYTDTLGISKILGKSTSTINRWKRAKFIPYHQVCSNSPVLFDIQIIKIWWKSLHTQGKRKY